MPSAIEDNHDFLNQKQEHPVYPKRERLPVPEEEKAKGDIKGTKGTEEKVKKPSKDDQMSLF